MPEAEKRDARPFTGFLQEQRRGALHQELSDIGYRLVRPHDVVLAVLAGISERLTEAGFEHVYLGAPPA